MSWLPGWPQTERAWVTLGIFLLAFLVVGLMAFIPELRRDDLFKVLAQAIILTALVNAVIAFHFSANKAGDQARDNVGKAFDAITASANAMPPAAETGALKTGDTVQLTATDESKP